MHLNEVLQLNKTTASIKKIDLFLASCNKKSIEYYQAFCYRNLILHSLGKTNDALKALYAYVPEFPKLKDEEIIAICDAIIEITLSTKQFDQARKFIDEKKQHLKVSNALLNTKDEISLAIAKHDTHRAISELKTYLLEILTIDESLWGLEQLAGIYYEVHDYKSYLELIPRLERLYQDSLNTNKLIKIEYRKLEIAFDEGNYVKVICDGNRLINEYDLDMETGILVATLLLRSYIQVKDYRKASIIESNYEEHLSQVSAQTALGFSKAALELYTQTNSLISMKHYQDLINEYNVLRKKQGKTELPRTGVIIPRIKEDGQVESFSEEARTLPNLHELTKNVKEVYVSSNYIKLEKLFAKINNLDDTVKFREVFRTSLIELSKFIPFEEAFLLYYDRSYMGLHYKKERAYDKRLEYEGIEDTINFLAIAQEQEVYIEPNSLTGLKNIVTKEQYLDVPYGIAIPLFKEDIPYASIAFWSSEPFIDRDMVYETLKLISQMIHRVLCSELKQDKIRFSNKKMFFIYEHMSSGIKELMEGHIHLSQQAKDIFGSLEDITEEEFKSRIHASDLAKYEAMIEDIYRYLSSNQSIVYRYKKNQDYIEVKETFFPSYENGIISLYSLIEDYTNQRKKSDELYTIAFTNPVSKLETEVKLGMDLKESMQHRKLSLAVLDIHDFKLYEELYGINFANQLIYAIAEEMKAYYSTNFQVKLYHLGFDRYAILILDSNDKRTIDALLLKSFDKISKNLNLLNSRIKLYFNCGVYRLSKSAGIEDPNRILDNAYDALEDAKRVPDLAHHISHYDSEASKLRFNENQLITSISEAIDHGRIGITYKQMVSLAAKEIYAYVAQVSLDNYTVDPSYMTQVIARRGLEEQMDKYVINGCSKELKMLSDS
ncbi:MAG: GGDEF domain-containing protein, partial [Anaeroplasmataceae bacterium]|nr:GGDEF domain-containing protein [Anaeroplasmataceae bacterium]